MFAALALVIAARVAAYRFFPLCAEDAYITFHASLDPAWMKATTSPLWAMLCSFGDPPTTARTLALVADCAAVWAAWRVLPRWGLWAFVALWVSPFFTGSAVSGLETHIVAAALLLARAHPAGYAIAAALRPDAAILSLCAAGRRWRWALGGAIALVGIGLCTTGHVIPQTITSKALAYGIHPGAWGWLHPQGFGWMTLALVPAFMSKQRLFVASACAFLAAHVVLGTVPGWWYAVPPLAMLGFAACERITRPVRLVAALVVMSAFVPSQWVVLRSRTTQEAALWRTGQAIARRRATGTILMEPAGMIPYENQELEVVDDVGLTDPWMAQRRAQGKGWRTDAIARYKPRFVVVRMREYVYPGTWSLGASYYGNGDEKLPGYSVVLGTDLVSAGPGIVKTKLVSSNLLVLMRN